MHIQQSSLFKGVCLLILIMWAKVKKFVLENRSKILAVIGLAAFGYFAYRHFGNESQVKLSAFINALKNNHIEEVVIEGQTIYFKGEAENWYQTFLGSFPINQIFTLLNTKKVVFSTKEPMFIKEAVTGIIGMLMSFATINYMLREAKSDPNSMEMKPKVYESNITFQDFYGGDIIKTKLRQIIDFLHHPDKFKDFGARIRRGVLLYGPPGTGKTMLARALANEARCEFIKVAASEFQEIFVGMGAKRVRQLFKEARQCERGCIIFIDEIDALGSRLNHLRDTHQTTSTINQFLSEMDGFSQLDKVVVVASTNRIDLVDAAVLRAGRFDIKVQISLPCLQQRIGIIKTLIAKKIKRSSITQDMIRVVSERSQGYCGADFEALLNEAVYKAIRERKSQVDDRHLAEAQKEMLLRKV